MCKTVDTFIQKVAKKCLFTSVIQDTNVLVGFRLLTTGTNVTTVLVHSEGNYIWFKISSNGDRRSNTNIQAHFKVKT